MKIDLDALGYDELVTLNQKIVERLKFLDVIQEEAADAEADDAAALFDVDFSLMSLELRNFIQRLIEIYGGLNKD